MERNDLLTRVTTWMDLIIVVLSERSSTTAAFRKIFRKCKLIYMTKQIGGCLGMGRAGKRDDKSDEETLWDEGPVCVLGCHGDFTGLDRSIDRLIDW